ncbi:unnamed protein product [Urochloa decumbens]|uniref:Uncharacterized protein n=1 Tax=Urochloa decumbens TaxID=240449 RepID=A0ABC9HF31_9POAL
MATPPVPNLSISGAALLRRCAAATGDCDGLLFGRAARRPLRLRRPRHRPARPRALHLSLQPLFPLPPILPLRSPRPLPAPILRGSLRRRRLLLLPPPHRPSMREVALAHSLSKTLTTAHPPPLHPRLALRLPRLLHPHLRLPRLPPPRLPPPPGLAHRRQRRPRLQGPVPHSFYPQSPMPCLPIPQPSSGQPHTHTIGEQKAVDEMVDGFGIGRLQRVLGYAAEQAAEMDDMYAGMLSKLEKLAKEVEKSNLRVLEQEKRNLLLRSRYAGML